jgi:hypothetical protein
MSAKNIFSISLGSAAAILVSLLLMTPRTFAAPSFTNVTQDDFDHVSKELSADFAHPSVMGAESLGHLFGVEAALVGGMTPSPRVDDISQRSSGNSFKNLYNVGLALGLTVPFGITGEAVVLPRTKVSGVQFQAYSLAAKITLNEDLLSMIPFNLAVRGFYSSAEFNFDQNSGGVNGTIKNKDNISGLQLLASPRLPIIEPYVGIGVLKAKNKLSVDGTGTVFDPSFTTAQSADSTPASTQFLLGINAKLLLLSLGAEYSHAFDSDRYMAKVGLAF